MIIDMHIHSNASDGKLPVQAIIKEAKKRNIGFMSVTDHDSIGCQTQSVEAAKKEHIRYVTGVELNITFVHPKYHEGKTVSLDFLGYQFDAANKALESKLEAMAKY